MTEYYYFESFGVTKYEDIYWYWRERDKHTWIRDFTFEDRFIGVDYSVIAIDYDKETETVSNPREVANFSGNNDLMEEALKSNKK